jgi:hypothetical protein
MSDYPRVQELECLHGITWGELAELEPQLDHLLRQASLAGPACRDRTDAAQIFAPFRNALPDLLGFSGTHRHHPQLGSLGAYEVASWKLYHTIIDLLPPPGQSGQEKIASARTASPAGVVTRYEAAAP